MEVLNSFDTTKNFWILNPNFLIRDVYSNLHKKDKSKNKEESSKIMWAIALLVHQDPSNTFKNLSPKKKEELIIKEYLKDPKFKFSLYKEEIKTFEEACSTPMRRQLTECHRFLDEKTELMKTMTLDLSNWEMLQEMIISNKDLHTAIKKIEEDLEKEGSDGTVKGNSLESASERDII